MSHSWQMMANKFYTDKTEYWCARPDNLSHLSSEEWMNMSSPIVDGEFDRCHVFDIKYESHSVRPPNITKVKACDRWEYFNEHFQVSFWEKIPLLLSRCYFIHVLPKSNATKEKRTHYFLGSLFFSGSFNFMYFSCKKCTQFCHQRFTNFISRFFLFFCYFFPQKETSFFDMEVVFKNAILHACKGKTLCKQAQKFGRLSSENLSSYLKTFFKRNGCLRYKEFNLLSYTISFNLILPLPCQHYTFRALIIRLLLKTRIHKI